MCKFLFKVYESLIGPNFPWLEESELFDNFLFIEIFFRNIYFDFFALQQKSFKEYQIKLIVGVCLIYIIDGLNWNLCSFILLLTDQSTAWCKKICTLLFHLFSKAVVISAQSAELFKSLYTLIESF